MWRNLEAFRRIFFALCLLPAVALPGWTEDIKWNDHRAEWLGPKQALRNAHLSERERAALASAIRAQIETYRTGPSMFPGEDLDDVVLDSLVKLLDLNGDGIPELIVQGPGGKSRNCSPTGNCQFWVFQRTNEGYTLVLDCMAQTFHIEKSRTNGWRDIVLSKHDSATRSSLTVFVFGRTHYVDMECYVREWEVLEGDTLQKLKKPRMTPCRQQ